MKTVTIRIPAVEAAMLQDLKVRTKEFRDLEAWFVSKVREAYEATYRQ